MREMDGTLAAVEGLIEADLNRALEDLRVRAERGEVGQIALGEDQKELRADAERNVRNVREAFRIASKGEIQERVSLVSSLAGCWLMWCRLCPIISSTASPSRSCTTRSSPRRGVASIASGSSSISSSRGWTPSRVPIRRLTTYGRIMRSRLLAGSSWIRTGGRWIGDFPYWVEIQRCIPVLLCIETGVLVIRLDCRLYVWLFSILHRMYSNKAITIAPNASDGPNSFLIAWDGLFAKTRGKVLANFHFLWLGNWEDTDDIFYFVGL